MSILSLCIYKCEPSGGVECVTRERNDPNGENFVALYKALMTTHS